MNEHTPGPHFPKFSGGSAGWIGSQATGRIASIRFLPDIPADKALGNLRLWAAATDLLAACELLLTKDTAMADRFGDRWPLDLSAKHAANTARAAIAKAGGE